VDGQQRLDGDGGLHVRQVGIENHHVGSVQTHDIDPCAAVSAMPTTTMPGSSRNRRTTLYRNIS
jgi:hypothetical protein